MIQVKQDGKQLQLPDTKALAARSRSGAAHARQRPRREQEHQARSQAIGFAAATKTKGHSYSKTAMQLGIQPRTLTNWCFRHRRGEMNCRPRGRPHKVSPLEKRLEVAELLRDTGPHFGIPSMRRAFPKMPPCELNDLRGDYWQVYRHHNRVVREKLSWHFPGRVWAMDHAKPPNPVDGIYPKMFAVRDLASGMELDWLPVPDETAKTTRDALLALFRQHGPPLVLKSDNGSAFKAQVIDLLDDWQVTSLLSPPATPRYNGSREASIGALKNRTHYLANDPGNWTSDDTEAARCHSNEYHYPNGHTQPNAMERWRARSRIDHAERKSFLLTIQRQRHQMQEVMYPEQEEKLTAAQRAAVERRVVRQALVEQGILSVAWRSITLPIKPRKYAKIM